MAAHRTTSRLQAATLLLLCCAAGALGAPAHPWNPIKLNLAPGQSRDGYLYVPPTYTKSKPSPLIIFFHPAGKGAKDALDLIEQQQPLLDRTRTLVLLPESRGPTWDLVMRKEFGADMVHLRSALPGVMRRYNIDAKRVALAGFSDGATVAISLLPLGAIASHIIAWSPGGFAPPLVNGAPKVAMFHGTKDELFPIDKTSQLIVQQVAKVLPNSEVNYAEGAYAHELPPAAAQQGLEWFLLDKPIKPAKFSRKGKAVPAGAAAVEGGPRRPSILG